MVSRSGRCALAFAVCLLAAVPARAQSTSPSSSIGFVGGATIDPKQVYGGVFWETPPIGGRFSLRPGIDGSVGDDLTLASINFDVIAGFPLGRSHWTLLQGGGPSIVVARFG